VVDTRATVRPSVRFVLVVWAASRALWLAVGALAPALVDDAVAGTRRPPAGALSDWAHWDGAWYLALAGDGYGQVGAEGAAFYPAYPLAVRAVGWLVGAPAPAGVVVSSAALLCALLALFAVAREHAGEAAARWSVVALALFPTSFFLGAVYTEALFLAFALGAWWAARVRGDLLLAAALAAGAALTRNVGVLLVVPLALEWRRRGGSFAVPRAAALLAPVAALGAFALYLGHVFGDPALLVTAAQGVWERSFSFPVATVVDSVRAANGAWPAVPEVFAGTGTAASFTAAHLWNLAALALAAGLLWAGRRLVPAGLTAYAGVVVALPVLTPSPGLLLWSTPRYVLSAFPLFITLGAVLAARPRWAPVWIAAGAAFGAVLCALFVTWRWVA
jgi:hypothetical protein